MNERLLELAVASGIVLEYHDIWGRLHRATDATLRAILSAMGIDAADDVAVERSLAAARLEHWSEPLPPAIVVRDALAPWTLRLNLPAHLDRTFLDWSLQEESGAMHRGRIDPQALPLLEQASVAGHEFVARSFVLELGLPHGYHRLSLQSAGAPLAASLIAVTPSRCYWPPALAGDKRIWGATAQLYAVRSARNWGVGDFSDLGALVEQWGTRGAAVIGVNPLHALYPHNPDHASPYSPSSRLFRNWIYIDVEACPEFAECEQAHAMVRADEFQARLQSLRATDLVDYVGVANAKRAALELVYAHFRRHHLATGSARAAEFRAFQAAGGEALRRHALFEAIQEHLARAAGLTGGWQAWPEALRDPMSQEVARFSAERLDRVEFFEYLQWLADAQYGAAAKRSFELGLGVGIYEDLAVSIDGGGAEAWANQDIYAIGASVGCPPDDFNLQGQDWGLPPVIPQRLRRSGYASFVATLRANMNHSGALRIDHVMQLMRLFWVPPGGKPAEGAYVRYPFADLLGLLALESERNQCLIIGEDLGTVPDEVRHALAEAGVLSYRLLYFERQHDGSFKPPQDYPPQAIVAVSTHDLPTLAGWWQDRDLDLRTRLGLYPNDAMREAQIASRIHDRAQLLLALERSGLLPAGSAHDLAALPALTAALNSGAHAYLASSPAKVMVVQLEDAVLALEQVNLPGTTDQYPNWRKKLPVELERLTDDPNVSALAAAIGRVRNIA